MRQTCIFVLSLFVLGCSGNDKRTSETTATDPSILTLTVDAESRIDVEHPAVQESTEEIDLAGRVDFSPNLVTKVYSLVNGTIVNVHVNQGTFVHKGDVLAEIYSGDFANAVSDFQKASAQLKTAFKNLARSEELAGARILSQRDLQQAASDSAQAKAEYDRAARVLDLLSGSRDSSASLFKMKAPMDGVVLERSAQIGSQVRSDNSQSMFTIGLIRNVWVLLDVYQDQIPKIRVGDKVSLSFDGLGDSSIVSEIRYITSTIDPATMTAKARCEVENRNNKIMPAMFCSAKVFHPKGKTVVVPATSAFYDGDGKTYVFAKLDTGMYQKREIHVGKTLSDKVEVLSGISSTDNVVTNQAIFLNEELQLAAR